MEGSQGEYTINEPRRSRSFGFGQSAEVVLIAFIAELFFQIFATFFFKNDGMYTWVVIVGNQVVFFATVLVFCSLKTVSFSEITGLRRPPRPYIFVLLLPIAFLSVCAFAPLASLFTRLIAKWGYSYSPDYHIPFSDPRLFAISTVALGVLPAIGEENLLRGALLSGTKRKSPLFALLYTSMIFALFHGNAVQLVHQFLLGLVMGYVALVTRGIWASCTVHCLNNVTALLLDHGAYHGWIDDACYSYFSASLSVGVFLSFFALSWVLLLGFLFLLTYLLKKRKERENARAYEKMQGSLVFKINSFLSYLASPSDREKEKEDASGRLLPETQPRLQGEGVLHIVLVVLLLFVIAAGVLSEVLK